MPAKWHVEKSRSGGKRRIFVVCLLLLLTGTAGCFSDQSYQSDKVASRVLISGPTRRNLEYQGVLRNPVIVIHGLLGSRLTNRINGGNVWGEFSAEKIVRPTHWRELALPMTLHAPLRELKNNVEHGGMLENSTLQLLGMSFSIGNYDKVIAFLEKYGYVRDGEPLPDGKYFPSLFLFDYDWRRDISDNAVHLDEFIREKKAMLQKKYEELYGVKNYDVHFDVIAHSMGGLLTRYYAQYGPQSLPDDGSLPKLSDVGSRHLEKILIVGTPNAGFLDALMELINGLSLAPMAPPYPPAVLGTFASYYFMMPHNEEKYVQWADKPEGSAVNIYDPEVWIAMKWGLADPGQDYVLKALLPTVKDPAKRREIALDHLRKNLKRAEQFVRSMRIAMPVKENLFWILFAGDAFETNCSAVVDVKSGLLKVAKTEAGDGKILATSTRFDMRSDGRKEHYLVSPIPWNCVMYFGASHMGLLSCSEFDTNMSFYFLNFGTERQKKLKDLPRIGE